LGIALGIQHRLVSRSRGEPITVAKYRLVGAHPRIGAPCVAVSVETSIGQIDIRFGIM
jgi:hypothetical protein